MKLKTLLVILLLPIGLAAQSPWQKMNAYYPPAGIERSIGTSPANAYFGSEALVSFGDKDIAEQLLFNGSVLLPLVAKNNFNVAAITSVDFSTVVPIAGFTAGLYPWSTVAPGFIVHGGAEVSTDGNLNNTTFGLYAGLEYAVFTAVGLPITASVAPGVTFLGDDVTVFGIDGTVIVPVANGLGLLLGVERLFDGSPTSFLAGLALNKLF